MITIVGFFMISVIIPVYNVENYLHVCINSVLKQSYQDFEIICIDDASTDDSLEILEYFAKKDSRIKIIKQDFNQGPGHSRNCGLNVAKGKYIFFLDGDDWIDFNTFEVLIKKADENDLDLLFFNEINFYGETHEFSIDSSVDDDFITKYKNNVFNHFDLDKKDLFKLSNNIWNKLYRKSFLDGNNIRFYNENLAYENIPFFYKVMVSADRISLMECRFYNYRKNKFLLGKNNNEKIFDIFNIYWNVLNVFIKNKQVYQYYKRVLLNYTFSSLEMKYDLIDNELKERFFIEIQSLFRNFIKYYDLYWDLLENVDSKILNKFSFYDVVERINNPPKLSIVVPVFNTGDYLPNVLESIVNQTIGLENIEVLLVDDCSTDNSWSIINKYCKKYGNIIGINLLENSQSPSKPRNIGVRNASSDYIIFQDSDDGFTENACEWLYDVIVEENVDLVTGMITRNDNSEDDFEIAFSPWDLVLNKYEKYRENDVKKLLGSDELLKLKLNSIDDNLTVLKDYALNSIIFNKSFLIKNNIQFPEYLNGGEDAVFLFISYIKAEGIVFINKVIYNYNTQRMDSLTHNFSLKTIKNRPKAYRLMYDASILNNKKDMYVENILSEKIPYWFNEHIFKAPELDGDLLLSIFKSQQILFSECIDYKLNFSDIVKSICQDIKDNNFADAIKKINDYRSNISDS